MSDSNWKRRLRVDAATTIGGLAFRLLGWSWRYRVHGAESFEACVRDGRAAAFALWHGEMLPLIWFWRGRGVRALISTHADGEIIARIVARIGYETSRGSTTRDGARALRDLMGALRDGKTIAVTPDGPRGPRHVFAAGVLLAARRTGAPIVLGRAVVDRAWVLRSWDRFIVPKPFARIELFHTPPLFVDAADFDADAQARRFADMLTALAPDTSS